MLRSVIAIAVCALVSAASSLPAWAQDGLPKRVLAAFSPPACAQVAANIGNLAAGRISKTTRYFTPLFRPGPDGALRDEDHHNCIDVEGSCIVGRYLYNHTEGEPAGRRYDLDQVQFVFGRGAGLSEYNKTDALFPCRTLAADLNEYDVGTVIYIPSFRGKICPQNGRPADGCFVVGDKGPAIRGKGRFDVFTGECSIYDGKKHDCRDRTNGAFEVPPGTRFYVVPRDADLARTLRDQVDAFITNGWKP